MNENLSPELQAEFEAFCEIFPLPADPQAWSTEQWMEVGFQQATTPMSKELDAWLTEQAKISDRQ